VLGLNPLPGRVDVVLASELLEASRVMLNGFVSPDRTVVITSSARTLTTTEKMQMGDGRVDSARLLHGLRQFSRQMVTLDMGLAAREAQTVLSAVMLGAIAGLNILPVERRIFEGVVGGPDRVASASLRGFDRGYFYTSESAIPDVGTHDRPVPAPITISGRFPPETQSIIAAGFARLSAYQDGKYADLYLRRVERILHLDSNAEPGERYAMTREFGRFLALWMAYEDVPRVADLKTRRSRFQRVRKDVGAGERDVVRVVDYFKPTIEEMCALLPVSIAQGILRWHGRRVARGVKPMAWPLEIRSDGLVGTLLLRLLASMKAMRRFGSRYAEEQQLIEQWMLAIEEAASHDKSLAMEVALCGRLIKGYGETHKRGKANLQRILASLQGHSVTTAAVQTAREAALADPDGVKLDAVLEKRGVVPRPLKAHPVKWVRRAARESQRV
jgi:indolepyruvate ferredoxin oxidoreductase beta subunit